MRRPVSYTLLVLTVLLSSLSALVLPTAAIAKNGFDLGDALIPGDKIHVGINRRDAIPAIHAPKFFAGEDALKRFGPRARMLVVRHKKTVKAYPIAVLNWHEIVNDTIAGLPIVITYCPLCGTGVVFLATVGDSVAHFGVSGLLYQSDVLLYDHETESLWSQVLAKAVAGKRKGTRLQVLGSTVERLDRLLEKEKQVQVLSTETGHQRDYDHDPYQGYAMRSDLMFPVDFQDDQVPAKAWCLLARTDDKAWIIPLSRLDPKKRRKRVKLGRLSLTITYDRAAHLINCPKPPPGVTCVTGYYFALRAFHHDAKLYAKPR